LYQTDSDHGLLRPFAYTSSAGGRTYLKRSKFSAKTGAHVQTGVHIQPNYYGSSIHFDMHNVMITDLNSSVWGAGIVVHYGNSTQNKAENCVISNCNYGYYAYQSIAFKNNIFLNDTTNVLATDGPSSNCATDKTAVGFTTDTDPQLNIVAANEFVSTDINSPNAFKLMLVGGQLIGRGTAPTITDNTSGFYGTSRPGRAGYVSIGPDEPQLDETLLGVGLTSNGVASLGNDGTFSSNVTVGGGGYNNGHLLLGSNHMWIDSSGNLRIMNGAPGFDSDGTVVGTQS
jgi:hypothetical protein